VDLLAVLLGISAMVHYLQREGFFELLSKPLLQRCRTPFSLLVAVSAVSFVCSALFMNDPTCLFLTPLVVEVVAARNLHYGPFLVALATSSNFGAAVTPIGSPQNLIIAGASKLQFLTFLLRVGPVACIAWAMNAAILAWWFRKSLSGTGARRSKEKEEEKQEEKGREKDNDMQLLQQQEQENPSLATEPRSSNGAAALKSDCPSAAALTTSKPDIGSSGGDFTSRTLASASTSSSSPQGEAKVGGGGAEKGSSHGNGDRSRSSSNSSNNSNDRNRTNNNDRCYGDQAKTAVGSASALACTTTPTPDEGSVSRKEYTLSGSSQSAEVLITPPDELGASTVMILPAILSEGATNTPKPDSNTIFVRAKQNFRLIAFSLVTVIVMVAFILNFPLAYTCICGATAMVVLDRRHPEAMVATLDGNLLLFFSSLFVVMHGVSDTGLPSLVWEDLIVDSTGNADLSHLAVLVSFSLIVLVGSNLISNVPLVLLLAPQMHIFGDKTNSAWLLLSWISTVAGNLTLVGSVATLIVAEKAKASYKLSFWEFTSVGASSTILSLLVTIPLLVLLASAED